MQGAVDDLLFGHQEQGPSELSLDRPPSDNNTVHFDVVIIEGLADESLVCMHNYFWFHGAPTYIAGVRHAEMHDNTL